MLLIVVGESSSIIFVGRVWWGGGKEWAWREEMSPQTEAGGEGEKNGRGGRRCHLKLKHFMKRLHFPYEAIASLLIQEMRHFTKTPMASNGKNITSSRR